MKIGHLVHLVGKTQTKSFQEPTCPYTKNRNRLEVEKLKKAKSKECSPRSVVKPGVTCSGMGRISCECFRLKHTSWYFVYETTADPCFDQDRQPGAISSSLCSTTENCQHINTKLSTALSKWMVNCLISRCYTRILLDWLKKAMKNRKYGLQNQTLLHINCKAGIVSTAPWPSVLLIVRYLPYWL